MQFFPVKHLKKTLKLTNTLTSVIRKHTDRFLEKYTDIQPCSDASLRNRQPNFPVR